MAGASSCFANGVKNKEEEEVEGWCLGDVVLHTNENITLHSEQSCSYWWEKNSYNG